MIPGQAPPCLWGQRALPGMGAYCGRFPLADAALHLVSLGNAGDPGDAGSIPGLGRPPQEGKGNLLQYSCLGNPMDRGHWQATVHEVKKESGIP